MQESEKSVSGVAVSAPAAAAAAAVVNTIPQVTAHVLNTVTGRPAEGVNVKMFSENQSRTWTHVADRYEICFSEKNRYTCNTGAFLPLSSGLTAPFNCPAVRSNVMVHEKQSTCFHL